MMTTASSPSPSRSADRADVPSAWKVPVGQCLANIMNKMVS